MRALKRSSATVSPTSQISIKPQNAFAMVWILLDTFGEAENVMQVLEPNGPFPVCKMAFNAFLNDLSGFFRLICNCKKYVKGIARENGWSLFIAVGNLQFALAGIGV